jgi:hypothetical protein
VACYNPGQSYSGPDSNRAAPEYQAGRSGAFFRGTSVHALTHARTRTRTHTHTHMLPQHPVPVEEAITREITLLRKRNSNAAQRVIQKVCHEDVCGE